MMSDYPAPNGSLFQEPQWDSIKEEWTNVVHEEEQYIKEIQRKLASARAIMEKFVNKVDTGRARSTETYKEMTEWLKEE